MASLVDDLRIIRTAVYGKEMRPAIYDALTQSWNEVMAMETSVEELSKRVDSLPIDDGGGDTPSPGPDDPDLPSRPSGECFYAGPSVFSVCIRATTNFSFYGEVIKF